MSTIGNLRREKLAQRHAINHASGSSFVLFPEQKLVVLTLGTRITVNYLVEYARLLREDPSFNARFSEIVDMRAAEDIALGADDMMKLADEIDPFSEDAKRAFVVRTASQAHAARMHKILRVERNFQIFRSLEAARQWIGA